MCNSWRAANFATYFRLDWPSIPVCSTGFKLVLWYVAAVLYGFGICPPFCLQREAVCTLLAGVWIIVYDVPSVMALAQSCRTGQGQSLAAACPPQCQQYPQYQQQYSCILSQQCHSVITVCLSVRIDFCASALDFLVTATFLVVLFLHCVQSSFLCRLGSRIAATVCVLQCTVLVC